MWNLFKAFIFKLRKDLTFRITLIVGAGIAVLLTVIYLFIDLAAKNLFDEAGYKFMFATGQNLFINSFSPAQNFGIAIPVNLITFTVLEFTQGTIRNKIIAGNSKPKIYASLFLSGLVFTISLITVYSLLSLLLGTICGAIGNGSFKEGFDINGQIAGLNNGRINPEFFWKMIVLALLAYVVITSFTIFFGTLLRNIGPCIPVVIILIFIFYMSSTIFGNLATLGAEEISEPIKNINTALKIFNPFHSLIAWTTEDNIIQIKNDAFIAEIINNIVYTGLFFGFGMLIFSKRDVK